MFKWSIRRWNGNDWDGAGYYLYRDNLRITKFSDAEFGGKEAAKAVASVARDKAKAVNP